MEIPESAYKDIQQELERQPLPINKYRKKVGLGRSNTLGVVNRRCLPADYSRLCWMRPYLYKLLLDFGAKYVSFPYTSITINENYTAGKHRDKGNKGLSFLTAFGDYQGGDLKIYEGDLSGNHNIQFKSITTDFGANYHSVEPWTGNRYSLVYYNLKRMPELPAPSVRLENNKYVFYRGDAPVTRKEPLPHPLTNRVKPKGITIKQEQVIVSFN